jgi:hypothetical protein
MNLMLVVMLVCVVLGLSASHFDRRHYTAVAVVATVMTGLYYFTTRFM